MSRSDSHLEAMVRHLGATYYQTLQGLASAADVGRAVEAVAAEERRLNGARASGDTTERAPESRPIRSRHPLRVRDVMTTDVVTVNPWTPYKQVARLLAEHRLSAVPVLTKGRRVAGMVSEADILRKQERGLRRIATGLPRWTRRQRAQAEARTVGELMTAPAITIRPDAPLGSAARLLNGHHIRRLPVVDAAGQLLGVVSRRDLLRVFLRPDDEIGADVSDLLGEVLLADRASFTVRVRDGMVTLLGVLPREQIQVASRLAAEIEGVVTVSNELQPHAASERVPHSR